MNKQDAYEYPTIIVCPGAWYDADKARALGFSTDAVKYSMGYITEGYSPESVSADLETAKKDFLNTYRKSNLSSFDEYLKAIALDVRETQSVAGFSDAALLSSAFFCNGCTDKGTLQKLFFVNGICYAVHLKPQEGSNSGRMNGDQIVSIATHDRSEWMQKPYSSLWRIYAVPNNRFMAKSSEASALYLINHAMHFLSVSAQHIISLKGHGDCFDNAEADDDYSPAICYSQCMTPFNSRDLGGCIRFKDHPYSPHDTQKGPTEYCNHFDQKANNRSGVFTLDDVIVMSERATQSPEKKECAKKCREKCERTFFKIALQSTISSDDITGIFRGVNDDAAKRNVSIVSLMIAHEGVMHGGIMTVKQVATITPAGFISNVGGALGLFVGATAMTLVQVIMFLIKCGIDRVSYRKVIFHPRRDKT